MGRVTLGKFGRARQEGNGDWVFPRGTPVADTFDEGDGVGFCYTVEGSGDSVPVELSIVLHPEGVGAPPPAYETIEVEPNVGFMKFEPLPAVSLPEGRPRRATFCARAAPGDEPVSASVLILPAARGRLFSGMSFAPATGDEIAAYEARFGLRFRPDYRTFLETVNGADCGWYVGPGWRRDPDTFFSELIAQEAAARAAVGADWESVRNVFGIGNRHPTIDLAARRKLHFYRGELMRHAYLVAEDGGGNNFVQVAQGRHAGRILLVDHEVYHGGLSAFVDMGELDEEERVRLPWTDFADAKTDDVIDKAEESGGMIPIADDFATFYARELAVMRTVFEAMAPKYRRS